jgi:hypothetical protein
VSALGLFAPRRLWRVISGDALNVGRDPMLLLAVAMSLLPALALHLARGPMDAAAVAAFGVAGISNVVVSAAVTIPAALIGWVTGFLLLEDRDEGTLLALDVTPVGKSGFLAYRAAITAALAVAVTLYAWPLLLPQVGAPLAFCLAALVALNAVSFAVVLPAIARNKVEGLAVTKLTNLLALAPLLAAIPSPWRYLGGVLPSFWIGELLGLAGPQGSPIWLAATLGLLINVAAVAALFRLFARRAG